MESQNDPQNISLNVSVPDIENNVQTVDSESSVENPAQQGTDDLVAGIKEEIKERLLAIESSEQYKALQTAVDNNRSLILKAQEQIGNVKPKISLANKYVKDFSDSFLKTILNTGWFEKYYDAICLFNKANDSSESLAWCKALKESLEESISDPDKKEKKIRALFNNRMVNSVFTLSIKTPYLRIADGSFHDIEDLVKVESRTFYGWLKNIETLSLQLKNIWIELEWPELEKTFDENMIHQQLEKPGVKPTSILLDFIEKELSSKEDQFEYLNMVKEDLDSFEKKLPEIVRYYEEDCVRTVEHFEKDLLNNYYEKDLESIYGIYDSIQLSKESLKAKQIDSMECDSWCSFLNDLSDIIIKFLNIQGIYQSPELVIGKSHIEDKFQIDNKEVDFYSFASTPSATDTPIEELIGRVASIRNYGFYRMSPENSLIIVRKTKVSVYKKQE